MAGLNCVVLVGRLTKTPELKKTTNSGASVVSFTLAIDGVPRSNGEKSPTIFIDCTCWNKTAENVAKYCSKGSLIGVEGRLNRRTYVDKNDQKRYVVEVVAESVQFLESKNKNENSEFSNDDSTFDTSSISHEGIDSSDDDLPF